MREYLELVRQSGNWVAHRDLRAGHGLLYADSQDLMRIYQAAVVKVHTGVLILCPWNCRLLSGVCSSGPGNAGRKALATPLHMHCLVGAIGLNHLEPLSKVMSDSITLCCNREPYRGLLGP